MGILQTLGNLVDKTGTALRLPEGNLSEFINRGKQTTYTGITPTSRNFGFVRNYGGDQALNINNPNPDIMRQVQKEQVRTIEQPLNKSTTPPLSSRQGGMQQDKNDTGGAGGGAGNTSGKTANETQLENTFKQNLSNEYADLRNKFGSQIGDITNILNTLPGQIKQLGSEYKTAIGEKQGADIAGVQSSREKVQNQQKEGLQSIAENVAQTMRDVSGRLANVGAGSSSAVNFFSRAIQKAGNENTRKILQQAANNYSELDNQENKIKSNYKTLLDKLDREEQANIQSIQNDVPNIINRINEALQKSGEYENLDKQGLTDRYLATLTPLFEQAKSAADSYRKQLESWRMDNQNKIADLRNQIVQEFTPKDITYSKLPGAEMSDMTPSQDNTLNPIDIKRRKQEEELSNPEGLSNIVKKLRDQQMQ